jgi:hypothetical protein
VLLARSLVERRLVRFESRGDVAITAATDPFASRARR